MWGAPGTAAKGEMDGTVGTDGVDGVGWGSRVVVFIGRRHAERGCYFVPADLYERVSLLAVARGGSILSPMPPAGLPLAWHTSVLSLRPLQMPRFFRGVL
jgi:hypothetical protein